MTNIHLPISKSIANRILLLQAIHGDELMPVTADMPDDVIVLHDALEILQTSNIKHQTSNITLHLKNCGTALRFLEVHLAQCYPDAPVTLTGDARLLERRGKPTTQTTSALILHGIDVPVTPDESPYITMSRRLAAMYHQRAGAMHRPCMGDITMHRPCMGDLIEPCWSSAAFWFEYIALHGGELLLEGLTPDSLQGDRIVADIYAEHFGVQTTFTPEGAHIKHQTSNIKHHPVSLDFERTPDLYPTIALTCERLGITLHATGTERLAYKECNRLQAVANHTTCHDHRMAMALLAADFPVDDTACIAKSYPAFLQQWQQVKTISSFH